jgi:parallel beta-helix repeat protein
MKWFQDSTRNNLRLNLLDDRIVPSVLFVDDDGAQFPIAPYSTIQSAVDAAVAGDTILVAAGTYTEQVSIPDDKDGLTIRSRERFQAIVQAPATMTGSKAIFLIDGADNVTIRGFTVTGPSEDIDFGIQVTNGGSATIRENRIESIRGGELSGAQIGIGIVIGGSEGAIGSADVFHNIIRDYQKGGIIVANEGSEATIRDNRIDGVGPTELLAQNGIQVSDGARAVIVRNTVQDHVYTGEGAEAAGIITSDSGVVAMIGNRLDDNQDGILIEGGSGISVFGNTVRGSLLDGIVLNDVTEAFVSGNRVTNSGRDGLFVVDTTDSVFVGNSVRGNQRDGIHVEGSSSNLSLFFNRLRGNGGLDAFDGTTGNGTAGTANLWFGNHIGTKSPAGLK